MDFPNHRFDVYTFQRAVERFGQNCKPSPHFYVDWVPQAHTNFHSPGLPGLNGQRLGRTQRRPFQNVPEGHAHPGSGHCLKQRGSRCLLLQNQAQGVQRTHTWLLMQDCRAATKKCKCMCSMHLDQLWPTRGPRVACGPVEGFARPSVGFGVVWVAYVLATCPSLALNFPIKSHLRTG